MSSPKAEVLGESAGVREGAGEWSGLKRGVPAGEEASAQGLRGAVSVRGADASVRGEVREVVCRWEGEAGAQARR